MHTVAEGNYFQSKGVLKVAMMLVCEDFLKLSLLLL